MTAINHIKLLGWALLVLLGSFTAAQARTSLVSLPARQNVAIRLVNQGTTLVQEKRILMLKKGVNQIDFSWQNVYIDPSSITLETLSNPDKISILSVSFPPGEAALVWDISSLEDLEQDVMISYLLANIDGMVTYKAVADPKEKTIDLQSFLVLRNFSGENFDTATAHTGFGDPFVTHIRNLETKQILVSQIQKVPIKKMYTWDALKMPHEPEKSALSVGIPTSFEFINRKESHLGKTELWSGKTRLFQEDSQGSTIFLGEDTAMFTPVGEKANLHMGDSRDIVVSQYRLETKKTNIKRNAHGIIQVYDELIKDRVIMENLKDSPVILSLIETIPGQWEPVEISAAYLLKDHNTLVFNVELLAKEKKTLNMHYKVLNIFDKKFSQYNEVFH